MSLTYTNLQHNCRVNIVKVPPIPDEVRLSSRCLAFYRQGFDAGSLAYDFSTEEKVLEAASAGTDGAEGTETQGGEDVMQHLQAAQRSAVQRMASITASDHATCLDYLLKCDMQVDQALQMYYVEKSAA
eukprot:CAMPEP_0113298842 /NCGR_PEP_ID=MMETSP0010_2-20120614/1119_1 /TAXON_ID=216773 ORGANISM="Corethron hystrix, Strain 308" /NCGR_SAMPLE_ID=MMETSP0010_2 /ASSEMBLY_ACC=CAM_ASM_000155 /LENGTH=128 /DNA_ID=CAMNT_0000151965 /DNA_START=131 /DNA_END=517 /DNA_ORIENTATION=+ /assembly_acc=CAM_ASM_000155